MLIVCLIMQFMGPIQHLLKLKEKKVFLVFGNFGSRDVKQSAV